MLKITPTQEKGIALLVVVILVLSAIVGVREYRNSQILNVMVCKMDSIQSIPTPKEKDTFVIHINTISEKEISSHPLTNDTLSEKLIRTRVRYGGFVSMEQLYKIMPRDSISLKKIESYMEFDTTQIVKYQVNVDNAKLLSEHPYINKRFAQNIVDYREENGKIKDFEELKKIKYYPKSKEKYFKYYIKFD